MFKKMFNNKWFVALIQGLVVSVLVVFLYSTNFFFFLQSRISDALFVSHPVREDIVIVAIDNDSLQNIGRWPWDRSIIAELVDQIAENGAKAIGLDVALPESQSPEQDFALEQVLARHNNVILPVEGTLYRKNFEDPFLHSDKTLYPIPAFQSQSFSTGLVNMPPDQDGIVRQQPIVIQDERGVFHEAFFIKILRRYLDIQDDFTEPLFLNNHYIFANKAIPVDELGRTFINFAGPPNSFQTYSASDVLTGAITQDIFNNKIVFIGATAANLHDEQIVPTSKGQAMPGVEIHANSTQTFLDSRFLKPTPRTETILLLTFLIVFCSFLFMQLSLVVAVLIAAALIISILVLASILFEYNLLFPTLYFLIGILLTYFWDLAYKYFHASSQKKMIRSVFQHYVAAPIVNQLLDSPEKLKLGGEKKEVTILFSDIRGFTSISEKSDAETLVSYLNSYLHEMTEIIISQQGVIDKFIGDAIMAFWNAPLDTPGHEELAAESAIKMIKALRLFNESWAEKGYEPTKIGIGLNTGEVVAGNIGSENRFDYTIIGDQVNIGSRLEGLNKLYDTQILITESTYKKLPKSFNTRLIDYVNVKGKEKPLKIYELVTDPFPENWIKQFEQAITLYQEKQFSKALKQFQTLLKQKSKDHPTEIYIDRCKAFIKKSPPKNWNGVFQAKQK